MYLALLTFDCTSAATFNASTCFAASWCFIVTQDDTWQHCGAPDLGNDMSDITRWLFYWPESRIRNFPPFVLLALLQQRHRANHYCLPHRPYIEASSNGLSPAVTCVATCIRWLFGPWRFSSAPLVWTTHEGTGPCCCTCIVSCMASAQRKVPGRRIVLVAFDGWFEKGGDVRQRVSSSIDW
jgi:hypothetical protein